MARDKAGDSNGQDAETSKDRYEREPSTRLEDLRSYEILDTEPEETFDRIVRLCSRIFDMPVAFVTFIAEERQWHKARYGSDIEEISVDEGFCDHTIESPGVMVVPDGREDPRFADRKWVGDDGLVFYAGAPITSPQGYRLGTLCVLDTKSRHDFGEDDRKTLLELAEVVADELEFRKTHKQLSEEIEDHERTIEDLASRQAELRAQRAFMHSTLESIPGVWTVLDDGGLMVRANDSLPRVTGYTVDEIESMQPTEFVPPEHVEKTRRAIAEAFETGESHLQVDLLTKDGERIPYKFQARRFTFDGSTQVVTIGIDISDLTQAQAELKVEREFVQEILDTFPGIWNVRNQQGQIVRRNRSLERVTGYSQDEVMNMPLSALMAPEYRNMAEEGRTKVLTDGDVRIEAELLTKSGERIPYAFVGRKGMIGGEPHVVTVGMDISDLKQVEAELRERERMYRQLTDNIDDVFWISDVAKNEIVFTSPAYEDVWGRSLEELYEDPMAFLEAIHPDDRPRVIAALPDQVQGDWETEYRVIRPDGTVRWIRDNAFPIHDDEGRVYRVAGIAKNITDEVSARQKLEEARDEAEAANRAKSEFLSRMSHELRTPLNAILGYSQILLMDGLDKETREAVEDIEKAGRHLLELINEVLDISRIEAGRMKLSLESVDVREILDEVIGYAQPMAARASIALHPPTEPCTAHVVADNQRLKQVLLNLVSNAVKYNKHGGDVHISCRERDQLLRIEVHDTGRGLNGEQTAKLFQPFERLGLTDADGEGTGLGLSLSKNLVEVMGGEIGVESVPDDGSTFWVEFPKTDSPLQRAQGASAAAESVGTDPDPDQLCVLYIEDNLSNLKLLEHLMSKLSHVQVQNALQGRLGVELATSLQPDLILLDLNLPDMDGTEVIEALRRDPDTATIPIVVLSADATPKRKAELAELGIHAYFSKPLDVRAFLDMMEAFRS